MSPDRLVYMANQIGKFFESQRADEVIPGITNHIGKFWDPRMRTAIFAYMDAGGEGIDPPVREALLKLKEEAGQKGKPSLGEKSSFQGTLGDSFLLAPRLGRHQRNRQRTMPGAAQATVSRSNLQRLRFDGGRASPARSRIWEFSFPSRWRSLCKTACPQRPSCCLPDCSMWSRALLYRLPVPEQPLKAFGAIAIAQGLGPTTIAAGALLMGGIFVLLGGSGLLDRVAKIFPRPIIRGVQLSVGLLFCQLAWKLTTQPPAAFTDHTLPIWWLAGGAVVVLLACWFMDRRLVAFVLMLITVLAIAFAGHGPLVLGPSSIELPGFSLGAFTTAAVALVLPQLPLTFANSCLAYGQMRPRTYFGEAAFAGAAGTPRDDLGRGQSLRGRHWRHASLPRGRRPDSAL